MLAITTSEILAMVFFNPLTALMPILQTRGPPALLRTLREYFQTMHLFCKKLEMQMLPSKET
jgi:hypothetical protein